MTHETRAVVGRGLGLVECGAAQRVEGARRVGGEEERLAAMELCLVDILARGELATPAPLRLRPRREALLRLVERLLVCGGEEARQTAVLREREEPTVREERERVVQRPQLPIRCEPAVAEAPRAKLS
jgi:hypothetical protein